MAAQNGIEQRVEVIEQAHHLHGLTQGRDGGETHNVTEVYGDMVKVLRLHGRASFQSFGHRSGGMGWITR